MYVHHYLTELEKYGVILDIQYHPKKFTLFNGFTRIYDEQLKTKVKQKTESLLNLAKYTADFKIIWNKDYFGKIFSLIQGKQKAKGFSFIANILNDKYVSVIDVKPEFMNSKNSPQEFSLKQKWVFQRYGIYVQKIVPISTAETCLFASTFTPKRYYDRYHKKNGSRLSRPYKTLVSINKYLENINK